MTTLEQTIEMIEDSDTKLFFRNDLNGIEACALRMKKKNINCFGDVGKDYDGDKAIFIETNDSRTATRTNTLLLHEFAHLECPRTMYDLETSIYARKRRETKVNNFMIKEFIPVKTLSRMLKNNIPVYLIAEELMIEEETIKKAIHLYKENGLLDELL